MSKSDNYLEIEAAVNRIMEEAIAGKITKLVAIDEITNKFVSALAMREEGRLSFEEFESLAADVIALPRREKELYDLWELGESPEKLVATLRAVPEEEVEEWCDHLDEEDRDEAVIILHRLCPSENASINLAYEYLASSEQEDAVFLNQE